ncbi:MAG: DUF1015 family protein [Bacteroidota bacterium]
MKPIPFAASLPMADLLQTSKLVEDVKYKFRKWEEAGQFQVHASQALYILRLTNPDGKLGYGLLGLLPAASYGRGDILPHEATLEEGRITQIKALCDQQGMTKPVLLTYRQSDILKGALERALPMAKIVVDRTYLGYRYEYFALEGSEEITELQSIWSKCNPQLLVADGHHRLASSVILQEQPETGAPAYFSALLLADEWLTLDTFYRIITPHPTQTAGELLEELGAYFELTDLGPLESEQTSRPETDDEARGSAKKTMTHGYWLLYLSGRVYQLRRKADADQHSIDPIWFNDCILPRLFDIHDSRTDKRISSKAMGPRGKSLTDWARKYPDHAIFAGHPISGDDFFTLIEERKLLPPKSTCFYPRIPSGLVVYDWTKSPTSSKSAYTHQS